MNPLSLRQLPLLADMTEDDLGLLQGHCEWLWLQPGETIVRQGQPALDFYIIARGQVEMALEGDVRTRLALLGAGDFFGELSALTNEPAPATVVATETTSLLRLSREGLLELLERNPSLNRQIIATLSTRIREASSKLHRARLRERSLSDHIARQGARSYPEWVGTGAWSQRVRAAIARASHTAQPVVLVGEAGAGKELAGARIHYNSDRKEGPFIVLDMATWSEPRWGDALRLSAHGSLLLKHAHLAPDRAVEAVRRILPRAAGDRRGRLPSVIPRILACAPPAEERDPSPLEEALLDEGMAVAIPSLRDRREDIPVLVRHFLRKHGLLPPGEAALHPLTGDALRRLQSYPFLQANVRELERVVTQAAVMAAGGPIHADHLALNQAAQRSGRPKVGLALGGGVVRGCAHIGVLRALQEAAIPVDFLVGTSSGSLVGALYAAGLEWQELEQLVTRTGWLDIAEPCWPKGGFLTSRRMRSFFDRHIGARTFEDLRLPFAAVAADANSGQEVILRQGDLADAVRASTAIPGVFRPVELDGRLLVDGVVVNNVPASVARAMGADLVIAVDVTEYGFTSGPPRSMGEAVFRAFDIMARQTITASLEWADIVVRPQVGGLGGYSFKSAPAFVRRGYDAAREAVPAILARLEELRRDFIA